MGRSSGGLSVGELPIPPQDAKLIDVCTLYLDHYIRFFSRARQIVKYRSKLVVLGTALSGAVIAVVSVMTALVDWPWLALVSAVLAGAVTVMSAWDGHFRHKELWVQRTEVVSQLQELKRTVTTRLASGDDPSKVGLDGLRRLDQILSYDMATWKGLRSLPPASSDVLDSNGRMSNGDIIH